jgi:Ni,Fe-hydrogenase III small subunit/ferredoxin
MLEWIARGLSKRVVTTAYPSRPETPSAGFRGSVEVLDPDDAEPELEDVCPTGAIAVRDDRVCLDRARCILCGECVRAEPGRFRFTVACETAARHSDGLIVPEVPAAHDEVRDELAERMRSLRRSLHIRHVDAGSDGAEEWEIAALTNPYYDMQRLGLFFTAAPRHADILLVTGCVTPSMSVPLARAFEVMPEPKAVIAAGTDACSGGFAAAGAESHGVDRVLPVDVYVPGSPPSPIALLHGLLLAVGRIAEVVA